VFGRTGTHETREYQEEKRRRFLLAGENPELISEICPYPMISEVRNNVDGEIEQLRLYCLLMKCFLVFQFVYDVFVISRALFYSQENLEALFEYYRKASAFSIEGVFYILIGGILCFWVREFIF
jgi:hypothetical protein